jgi:hypothetical protein
MTKRSEKQPRLPDVPGPTVAADDKVVAGRGAGLARLRASPAYDTLVAQNLADQQAALAPKPKGGKR